VEFLDRFISVRCLGSADFKGVSPKGFDGRGQLHRLCSRTDIFFGRSITDAIDFVKGMNVTIVTTARTDAEGRALLAHLGMPFRQGGTQTGQGANA